MTFMLAAYAVFWIATFDFVFRVFGRQRSLRHDLDLIEQLLEEQEEGNQIYLNHEQHE